MLFGKSKKMIEDKENEIKLNLSNNYKDSAYKSYKELIGLLEDMHNDGKLSDKDYDKQLDKLETYKIMFKNFIK